MKNLDIFTPIIDEPDIAGQIAACNVTNDVFAMNVPEISGMLVFLAIQPITPADVAEGILKGIKTFMEKKVNSRIVGGHTIYSEWPLIGGEASGFVERDKIIPKQGVKLGDKLILTKPIGIQAIMASYRILKDMPDLIAHYSKSELQHAIDIAVNVMTTPNQNVIKTIHSYDNFSFIHAMSDVTGFGLAGHAKEMLQNSNFSITINRVPYIKLAKELSKELGYAYDECKCHETAGGMLISVASDYAQEFSTTLKRNKIKNWIIGTIGKEQPEQVQISENAEHIEISEFP